jgi:hypothetical protein
VKTKQFIKHVKQQLDKFEKKCKASEDRDFYDWLRLFEDNVESPIELSKKGEVEE